MAVRGKAATLLAGLALVMAGALGGPAWAHHKPGHTHGGGNGGGSKAAKDHDGDADSDPGTSYTEDNDTNDGGTPNNSPDAGDNKHPSGKDRSVEHGNSGNQGKSESDPDDDGHGPDRSNGGADKPNGPGGEDLADQDGNNGCGNDDDFEDDNEGWCGKHPKKSKSESPDVGGKDNEKPDEDKGGHDSCGDTSKKSCSDDVKGGAMTGPEVEVDSDLKGSEDEVLGDVLHRGQPGDVAAAASERAATPAPAGESLPFTGADILAFVGVAAGLMLGGMLLLRLRRSQS